MSRISEALKNKKSYVGFLTAGDPSIEKTEEFIIEMEKAGASVIEIGIPFSDPIAEGPIVQDANVRALSAPGGCTTDMVFDMVERVSKKVSTPIVFLTYLNPVFTYGYEKFCAKCKETGVSGVMIPDMPFEERGELEPIMKEYGIELISLVAPASDERIKMIAKNATGYIYVLPSREIIGDSDKVVANVEKMISVIREVTDVPVVTEFEIDSIEQAIKYSKVTDGIIAGDSIVKIIGKYKKDAGKPVNEYIKSIVNRI
ncbi:MAG: tryptophan synthase subunit alpha [Lachnospiraceae bacterium]|nr:tryptophan synthase subunit alpha [Lachnospiraceae bacterium]